jgi:hypothetical protein
MTMAGLYAQSLYREMLTALLCLALLIACSQIGSMKVTARSHAVEGNKRTLGLLMLPQSMAARPAILFRKGCWIATYTHAQSTVKSPTGLTGAIAL